MAHEKARLLRVHGREHIASSIHRYHEQLAPSSLGAKNDVIDGFTKEYKCHRLVWYESYDDIANAIDGEKQLKRWNRIKKEWLIQQSNPTWEDLAAEWYVRHQYEPEKKIS